MDLLRWMGKTFARFVGLSIGILGGWIFIINLFQLQGYDTTWVWLWVVLSGLAGLAGGTLFLLSFDGPVPMRTRRWRLSGWVLMLASAALPTSLTLMVAPMVLLCLPAVFVAPSQPLTSS